MDEILELARQLGAAIGASAQAGRLRAAQEELDKHPELRQALKDYQEQAQKIAQTEQQRKPVEVADKHKLQQIEDRLAGSDVLKKFMAAQVEYLELMNKVHERIRQQLWPAQK